jgi:dolichol-phosphate mannosyltransferase
MPKNKAICDSVIDLRLGDSVMNVQKRTDGLLSIVVPVYNEQSSLPLFYSALAQAVQCVQMHCEIILIDDGSHDGSLKVMHQLRNADSRVRIISFSRNFGHMAALSAGLEAATGEAVITLDSDMQHPPELIPVLVEKWRNGVDVVNTIRETTQGVSVSKQLFASLFYAFFRTLSGLDLKNNGADYRLLDRKVVDALQMLPERTRFLRGLIAWIGFCQVSVPYHAPARVAGVTKYSMRKMMSFAADGITSFSTIPLQLAVWAGVMLSGFSAVYLVYAIWIRFFTDRAIQGWTSVMGAVLFIGGIQLIFLGIIGQYLGKVFHEAKQRPLYILKEKIGFESNG